MTGAVMAGEENIKVFTVRDGQNRIVGNTTTNSSGDSVARDRSGTILGRSSQTFTNTRDGSDRLASSNTADPRSCSANRIHSASSVRKDSMDRHLPRQIQ